MISQEAKTQTFRALHQTGFIMPNAWDAGSAKLLASEGFEAIATTSAGIAFALGLPDYQVSRPGLAVPREAMMAAKQKIAEAVNIPVNADLEAGYGDSPEAVAETITLAIDAGLAGGNIEDKIPFQSKLYDETLAVERIAAARAAIASRNNAFVLTARTDPFLLRDLEALATAIRRGNLFLAAGADCIYPPGVADLATIRRLVGEIAGPINIVMGLGGSEGNANDVLGAGVRRISIGGAIARSALGFVRSCARELRDHGTLGFARQQIPQSDLNSLFSRALPPLPR